MPKPYFNRKRKKLEATLLVGPVGGILGGNWVSENLESHGDYQLVQIETNKLCYILWYPPIGG